MKDRQEEWCSHGVLLTERCEACALLPENATGDADALAGVAAQALIDQWRREGMVEEYIVALQGWLDAVAPVQATVYVVTYGEYSDYHIEAVFTSQEDVEAYVASCDPGDGRDQDPRIEEWQVGMCPDGSLFVRGDGLVPWATTMDRSGTVLRCERVGPEYGWDWWTLWRRDFPAGPWPGSEWDDDPEGTQLRGTVWATDPEHAAKILNERRVQLIAAGEWPAARKEGGTHGHDGP